MQRTVLRVIGLLSLLLLLSSCDIIFELLGMGEEETITISGTITMDSSVTQQGQVRVGLLDYVPPSGVTSYSYALVGSSNPQTLSYNAQLLYQFTGVPMGSYLVGAWVDVNSNGLFDSGEAGGSYPDAVSGNMYVTSFQGDNYNANITIRGTGTSGGSAPATPAGITCTPANKQVTVTWDASDGATSYTVYYKQGTTVTTASTTKVMSDSSPATVTGLTNALKYAFIVTASNEYGTSGPSGVYTATPIAATSVPAAPVLTALPLDEQVELTWSAVVGATSYNLYWSAGTTVTKTTGTKVSGVTSGYKKIYLLNDTPYAFILTAVNNIGESMASEVVTAVPAAAAAPSIPTGVMVSPSDGQVVVSWTAASNADWYKVYYQAGTTVNMTTADQLYTTGTTCAVGGLMNGTLYAFGVTAGNDSEMSGLSAVYTAMPAAATSVPSSPMNLAAAPADGKVVLTWYAVSGATSYYVYYKAGTSVGTTTGSYTARSSTSALTYTVQALANGTEYAFCVTAKNSYGESAASGTAWATPYASTVTLPATPTNLTATVSSGAVMLDWTTVPNATSYNLYYVGNDYSYTLTFVYPPFTVGQLYNGVYYSFAVAAVNSAGTSDYCAEITVMPQAASMAPAYAPSNVWTYSSTNQVQIGWNPVEGADWYYVYYSGGTVSTTNYYEKIYTTMTSFTKYNLANGATYSFLVTAANGYGESPVSDTVWATPYASATPPSPPTGLYAEAQSTSSIYVSWNYDSSVTGYYLLYYTEAIGTQYVYITTNYYTLTGLSSGVTYTFWVVAENNYGQSDTSNNQYASATTLSGTGAIGVTIY